MTNYVLRISGDYRTKAYVSTYLMDTFQNSLVDIPATTDSSLS